jgi:hypothetical protein
MPELLKPEKRLPPAILGAPLQAKAAFLWAYASARGRLDGERMILKAPNGGLAEDLQDLLLDLGIYSTISLSSGDTREYEVVVTREDLPKLLSLIGLEGGEVLAWRPGSPGADRIPAEVSSVVAERLEGLGKRGRAMAQAITGGAERRALRRAIEEVESAGRGPDAELEWAKSIVEGNIRFLEVVDVEVVENRDSEWVYDVTVEPYHLFVSHGLVLHNTISISKAGIVARLNARTSILAAGNPKLGLYDPTKSFVDNVNLPPTILSRFDLIFVLRDVPDKRRDAELAAYVLEAHTNSEKIRPDIDPQLLRKYILYARRYIRRVKLSSEAKEMLKDFFTSMRASALSHMQGEGPLPIPITTRQLEALVRLTEAHARMALREEAGPEDAAEAIRLTLSFLTSVGFDVETGVVDVGMLASGATYKMRTIMSIIQDIIKSLQEERGCAPLKRILEEAEARRIPREKAQDAVERMYRNGIIFEKGNQCYALVP